MLSQILDEVVSKRQKLFKSSQHLRWTAINSLLALFIYLDISYGGVIFLLDSYVPYIQLPYLVEWLKVLFMLNAVFNLYKYACTASFNKPLCVNPVLKKLFRIKDNEPGFVTSTPSQTRQVPLKANLPSPTFSPSIYDSFTPSSPLHETSLPFIDPSFHTSLSPLRHRKRHNHHDTSLPLNLSDCFNTSIASEDVIEDVHSLYSFLHEERNKQDEMLQMETAMHKSIYRDGMSFSSIHSHSSSGDFSLHYDLARPPHTTSSHPSSPGGTPSKHNPHHPSDVWNGMGVPQHVVDLWTERLRKYIRQSILCRVVGEVHAVNKVLSSLGMEESLIGSVSLAALKQLEASKAQLLPNLPSLLLFLQLSNNQQYLVPRIIELNEGPCLSGFRWNYGGSFKGKKWQENLPTDASILMHFLCTYLDSCLPALPSFSSEGAFTGQHFIKKTDKPLDLSHYKDSVYLQEVSINPPCYDVIHNGCKLNVKKGRDNFFHSVLLFFYLIKTQEHGLLRRVSLGLNGINILWIFDN